MVPPISGGAHQHPTNQPTGKEGNETSTPVRPEEEINESRCHDKSFTNIGDMILQFQSWDGTCRWFFMKSFRE